MKRDFEFERTETRFAAEPPGGSNRRISSIRKYDYNSAQKIDDGELLCLKNGTDNIVSQSEETNDRLL